MNESPQQLSIDQAFELYGDRVAHELASEVGNAGSQFSSPEVLDLLVWNVVVSYIVNMAASASFALLTSYLREHGRVNRSQLSEAREEVRNEVILKQTADDKAARVQITLILRQYGVPAETRDHVANRLMNILSNSE